MEQSGRKKQQKKNQWGWSMSSYQKRRISEQTYKFPKCIFPFFLNTRYIFILCTMSFSWSSLRCVVVGAWVLFSALWKCYVLGVRGWETNGEEKEREWEKEKRRRKMKRGRLGKAKKNQYMSDKKAQILDGSSVWVWSSSRILFVSANLEGFMELLMYSIHGKSESKMKEFSLVHRWTKLNWKFSIIYIWGNGKSELFLALAISSHPFRSERFQQKFSWWR